MKCTSTTGPLLTLRSVFPPSAPVSPSGLKPSSRFFLSPGSWVCGRAGVRAELFRKSAPDLRVAQPLHIQPRQLRGDLLWPQGKEEHSPAQRQPALLPPGPPAGAQRHPHTVWRAAIARGQVKTEGRQEHTAATEGRQRLRFEVFSQILALFGLSPCGVKPCWTLEGLEILCPPLCTSKHLKSYSWKLVVCIFQQHSNIFNMLVLFFC